ncbi:HEPN domain-containing protein [Mesorhizobium sp. M1B.F.Ca.ET.045.04.1.1]|uniref:ApeA N-terminal domain 1-containing protein n=1 Tax=Mesorhizobium sp. M1B.F.Ca.ET.045.04.1.1 TaxID=2493673 RepID=UPI000F75E6B0|nr:HEPN domain-containing protein [Mesorhizobium sp. M1B.F.Ca.ET.045.04.1.1]AZO30707.1 hypothetical protein EJ071_27115 [Mesorhizobium sp. M1B.F.Ca.ET.045.04.1.1]
MGISKLLAPTLLQLFDVKVPHRYARLPSTILGTLHDRRKATLLGVAHLGGQYADEGLAVARLLTTFVLIGSQHLQPDEESVSSIEVLLEDADALFYDFDAFGSILQPEAVIDSLLEFQSKVGGRTIQRGQSMPEILYYTGKQEFFSAETALGVVSANHLPSLTLGGAAGGSMKNNTWVRLDFSSKRRFRDAIGALHVLLRFFGMIAGRPQKIDGLRIFGSDEKLPIEVHWCLPPGRDRRESEPPHPADLPLNVFDDHQEYATVLPKWISREAGWADARQRYFSSLDMQRHFTIDRLIAAANMFDILPATAIPKTGPISGDLKSAAAKAKAIFKALPKSAERDSVLGELGRIGKAKLKQKVRHRAKSLVDLLGRRFPDLPSVVDIAVNCRNHFVHGTPSKVDFYPHISFLTRTLEFVFAASDLLESGWDIVAWSEKATSQTHPFTEFRQSYKSNLERLKAATAPKKKTPKK